MKERRSPSDALVLFGITGDLAHKMIFPALYEMVNHGTLTAPVIGVASSPYRKRSWGPSAADALIVRSGCWHNPK